ncbi:hypothetical protein HDV05_001079 [Chytridiales sp. JEL 0842]|nr:hypothetical protein HDV05_001079 [Chytridiales sp. JEL 0842]
MSSTNELHPLLQALVSLIPPQMILNDDPVLTVTLLSMALMLVSTVLLVVVARIALSASGGSSNRKTVLVVGLPGSGKTCLFTLLRFGRVVESRSSMKENEGEFQLSPWAVKVLDDDKYKADKKPVHVLDIPGHPRLRFKLLESLPSAKIIIFMLDSSRLGPSLGASSASNNQLRSSAELLMDVLSDKGVGKDKVRVVVVCNKQDQLLSMGAEKAKEVLEAEMDRIRSTRAAGVESQVGGGNEEETFLGYEGESFKFEQLENEVEFVETSLTGVFERTFSGEGGEEDEDEKGGEEDDDGRKWEEGMRRVLEAVAHGK